jgi:hypothetical protein
MMKNSAIKPPFAGVNSQDASWDETLRLEVQDLVGRLFLRKVQPDPADKMQWDRMLLELTRYGNIRQNSETVSRIE